MPEVAICPVDGTSLRALTPPPVPVGETASGDEAETAHGWDALAPSLPETFSLEAAMILEGEADEELKAGTKIGEYTISEKIGTGGMGSVYAGIHPGIGKKVAIKLLSLGLSQNSHIAKLLVQEARAVKQIGHPN